MTLTFGVHIPEAGVATRSMADPAVTSLNLLVFDQNGYLVETATATVGGNTSWEDKTTPTDAAKTQAFTVTLTKTSAYRAIHFVANADVSGLADFGHEDALIPSLVSTDTDDAYWQRMEFANGIASDSGTKLDNSTVVPLVRNFAKVTVTESLSNFVLEGFVVMNTRSEGTVAAYNAREREFAEFVDSNNKARAYSAMIAEYNGFEAGEQQNATPADAAFTTASKYVRETAAGATDGTNPYIIVKGKWVASGTPTAQTESKYYRLDFVNAGGTSGLAAILRNFSYNFTITSVEKAGMSLDEVMNATEGENNLSFQEATQSLLNISDGTGQLFVSATNVTLVSNEPYILMYKYVPNISTGTTANGSASYARKDAYNADRSAFESTYFDSTKSGTIDDAFINAQDASMRDYYKEFKGYSYITLLPRSPQANTLNDVIVITGGELAREVRFTLQEKINMTVEAYDGNVGVEDNEVARATGEKVWVNITIPANLSQYIFPLEFEIEAGALSIYPDANPNTNVTTAERNNMPVRTGATIAIDEATGTLKSGNTFRFVRTLSLAEYNALKTAANGAETVTFTSQFLTNKDESASQVYVANHYFNTGFDGFANPKTTANFTNVALNGGAYYGANQTVTLTFKAPDSTGPINVKLENIAGLTPTGTANEDGTYTTTYSGGTHTLTFTTNSWGGPRSVTFSADTSSVKYNSATASATVNKIHIAAGKLKISGIEYAKNGINQYAESATVTVQYNGSNVGQFLVNRNTTTNSGEFDLSINSLPETSDLSKLNVNLSYTTTVWGVRDDYTTSGSATTTIGNLVNCTQTITFN